MRIINPARKRFLGRNKEETRWAKIDRPERIALVRKDSLWAACESGPWGDGGRIVGRRNENKLLGWVGSCKREREREAKTRSSKSAI